MAGPFHYRFENAVRADDPHRALEDLAAALVELGIGGRDVLDAADQFRAFLRAAERESDEAAVMDLMDTLVGWTTPSGPLWGIARS
ncbi:MAG: hypothetical protein ACR2GE_09755 [Pseudonocardia sp.]